MPAHPFPGFPSDPLVQQTKGLSPLSRRVSARLGAASRRQAAYLIPGLQTSRQRPVCFHSAMAGGWAQSPIAVFVDALDIQARWKCGFLTRQAANCFLTNICLQQRVTSCLRGVIPRGMIAPSSCWLAGIKDLTLQAQSPASYMDELVDEPNSSKVLLSTLRQIEDTLVAAHIAFWAERSFAMVAGMLTAAMEA